MADRAKARLEYIKGNGSVRAVAEALGLSPETVKVWSLEDRWTQLREDYQNRQLERFMGDRLQGKPEMPTLPTSTPPQNAEQARLLAEELQEIRESMKGQSADTKAKLANAFSRIFEAWCVLTGTQRPGVRKAPREGRRGSMAPVMPLDEPAQPGQPEPAK